MTAETHSQIQSIKHDIHVAEHIIKLIDIYRTHNHVPRAMLDTEEFLKTQVIMYRHELNMELNEVEAK